jgi:bifunctional enzyme Fae/Hps
MMKKERKLSPKKRYLQIALNGTLDDAFKIISSLPVSDRILVEAGTPLIKRYGEEGIRQIKRWYEQKIFGLLAAPVGPSGSLADFARLVSDEMKKRSGRPLSGFGSGHPAETPAARPYPYAVADLKMMDRGSTEVDIAVRAGADAAVAMGMAPKESLDAFVSQCDEMCIDAMIDMMNVEYPLNVLRSLKKIPPVAILHRGVDESEFNKQKQIPLHEIRRLKGAYDIMVSVAGGDTIREVQRAFFNDADIVVVWKSFYQSTADTAKLAEEFLREVK